MSAPDDDFLIESVPSGFKAIGLLKLPGAWVPYFRTIGPGLQRRWAASGKPIESIVSSRELQELAVTLEGLTADGGDRVIIRSNHTSEDIELRGLLSSHPAQADVDAVLRAMDRVYSDSPTVELGLIIQAYHPPRIHGHLSNERRVSAEARRFICESQDVNGPIRIDPIRVERHARALPIPLSCHTTESLREKLRSVAKYVHDLGARYHLEWVWDGARLWIVQNDVVPAIAGLSPLPSVPARAAVIGVATFAHLRPLRRGDGAKWQKIACVEMFKRLGFPTTKFNILEGARIISALARGNVPMRLLRDLRHVTRYPVVIRSDVSGPASLLAPRTDAVQSADDVVKFLVDASARLTGEAPASAVAFIFHGFIPARASAFALARADAAGVTIDALWGLPDGLLYLPHDSFTVSGRNQERLTRRVRYKGLFLSGAPGGEWSFEKLGPPWDWRQAIRDEEAREIARMARAIARQEGKTLQLMCFVGIPRESGHPAILPWRYTTEDTPARVESAVASRLLLRPFVVATVQDVERLRADSSTSAVILRPAVGHIRDDAFLREVAHVARDRGIGIILEGSVLQHAFYVLQREGAVVSVADAIKPSAPRQSFRKLVRDRVPDEIRGGGEIVTTATATWGERLPLLKRKLIEEAFEVLDASGSAETLGEIADVYEVIRALCAVLGVNVSAVRDIADRKRDRMGGFEGGVVLLETGERPPVFTEVSPTLFEEGVSHGVVEPAGRDVAVAGSRRKARVDRIIIPFVPPATGSAIRRLELRAYGVVAEVRYHRDHVEVLFGEPRQEREVDQLELKFG